MVRSLLILMQQEFEFLSSFLLSSSAENSGSSQLGFRESLLGFLARSESFILVKWALLDQ